MSEEKILILGDTHGNTPWAKVAIEKAASLGVDKIIQVGDFGYWPRHGGLKFIQAVSRYAVEHGIDFYWIDGNHEDFKVLHGSFGKYHPGPRQILPNLFWMSRGSTAEFGGKKFLFTGGAASIDRGRRKLGKTWFLEEMITDEDVSKAVPADIVVAHDSPINVLSAFNRSFVVDDDSEFCRAQMRRVINIAKPELLFHGHYHFYSDLDKLRDEGYTRCVGLGTDGSWDSMLLLTIKDGSCSIRLPNSNKSFE